jgi:hypothetical protein
MFTAEFKAMTLKEQATIIKALRQLHKEARVEAKQAKAASKAEKAKALQAKRAAAIVKAQARLQRLLEKQAKPVGTKALKAAKRPSKAIVLKGQEAANAVAA